ncbi:AfsA-related hotdog domain-containing protein [Microbacterium sp. DT81.1]|uniref:AfsA-related hotdog domain-containing protein n=1 Tax=Microbacterium sp. DT81.1 TaxID=3393413 RepID=UPI003CE7EBBD
MCSPCASPRPDRSTTTSTSTKEPRIPKPSYNRTIHRDLVHRASVAEVFVTGLRATDDGRHEAAIQLPRSHAYFGDHTESWLRSGDLLLLQEAFRQSGMAVMHRFHGLPTSTAFLLRTLEIEDVAQTPWRRDPSPARLVCDVSLVRPFLAGDRLVGGLVAMALSRDGAPGAKAQYSFSGTTRGQWEALRASAREGLGLTGEPRALPPGERASPATVGRIDRRNVVITEPRESEEGLRADLVVDTDHATLFDHPLDHVPGALVVEAARQLAVAFVGKNTEEPMELRRLTARFTSFIELDLVATATAVATSERDDLSVVCQVSQKGRDAASITLQYRPVRAWT